MQAFTRLITLLLVGIAISGCSNSAQPSGTVLPHATQSSALSSTTAPVPRKDANTLSPVLTMTMPRAAHSATLLPNGRVLIAGGFREEGTREIAIDSATVLTLLQDGRVLITGGYDSTIQPSNQAWIYS